MQIQSVTAAVLFPKEFLATFQLTRKRVTFVNSIADGQKRFHTVPKGKSTREVTESLVYEAIGKGLFLDTDIAKHIGKCVTTVRSYARLLKEKGLVDVRMCGPKNTKFAYFKVKG